MRKTFFSLLLFVMLSFSLHAIAFARTDVSAVSSPIPPTSALSCAENETSTDLGCIPNDPAAFAQKFYGIGLGLIGGVALLFIIFGGYLVMTSSGDPGQLSKGRGYILYAIVGLLLAIFGFVFMQTVAAGILHIPGFS